MNDNKEEIKRNYYIKDNIITKMKIIIDYEYGLFKKCKYVKSMNCIKLDRNDISNMSDIFYRCSSWEELNLSNFNTNNSLIWITCSMDVHH